MSRPRTVVMTGMHRSGTSLVASIVAHAGVAIGDRLMAPNPGNPRGYFEDLDFLELHEHLLRRSGPSALLPDPTRLAAGPKDAERAGRLVSERRERELWGFKDPRACLFLDFWHHRLSESRYVFVYRHPLDVALSLCRRGADPEILADPMAGLRSWKIHNRRLLDFYGDHAGVCVLCDVDALTADPDRFLDLLEDKLDVPVASRDVHHLIAPEELHKAPRSQRAEELWRALDGEAGSVLDELRSLADLPHDDAPVPRVPHPDRPHPDRPHPDRPHPDRPHPELDGLREVIADWPEDPELRTSLREALFAHLLARLEPEAAAPARLRALQAQLVHDLRQRLDERGRRLLQLQDEFDERTAWALKLDAYSKDLESRIETLAERVDALDARLRETDEWSRHLQRELQNRDARLKELEDRQMPN